MVGGERSVFKKVKMFLRRWVEQFCWANVGQLAKLANQAIVAITIGAGRSHIATRGRRC